jgi:hypothetical protein
VTSGGEIEHDRMSKRANLAEGLGLYLLIQAALWGCLGAGTHVASLSWLRASGYLLLAAAALHALVVAPWLHGDDWHARGLARPNELRETWARRQPRSRTPPLIAPVTVVAFVGLLVWTNWDYLLIRLGIRYTWPEVYSRLTRMPFRQLGACVAAAVAGGLSVAVVIRQDNLRTAAKSLLRPVVVAVAGIAVAALALAARSDGSKLFSEFVWTGRGGNALATQFAFYILWGILQQSLLLGYLNTRIRRGVPHAGRTCCSGRILTAGLTGIAFGGLHLPAWPLVVLTFLGGSVFGWLFQKDCHRNLFVMGAAHGVVGTLAATTLGLSMQVGP